MIRRHSWLILSLCLASGCRGPAAPMLVTVADVPVERAGAIAPTAHAPASSQAPASGTAPGVTPAAAPSTLPPGAGGGGVSAPSAPSEVYLNPSPGADTVPVPAGAVGQASLFMPGMVPSSIQLPGGALTLHPLADGASATPTGTATVTGTVPGAGAGLIVQYLSQGRTLFAGGQTQSDDSFSFSVPLNGTEPGVVVVRESGLAPRLAVARVTLADGQSVDAGALTLSAPVPAPYRLLGFGDGAASSLPTPPSGLALSDAALQLAETNGAGVWRATVLALSTPSLPRYDLPGFTPVESYMAAAPGGMAAAETSGPPGSVPAFLAPPALDGLPARVSPGTALSWPAVSGATLYTVRLVAAGQEDSPVWEGASTTPGLIVPTRLSEPAQDLTVEVDAWDAPELTIYTVASIRRLRIPSGPAGPQGRHSWSRRTVPFQP